MKDVPRYESLFVKPYLRCSVLAITLSFAGCTGLRSSDPPATTEAAVSVALNQSSVSLAEGATTQFTATVKGSTNTAVTWSVDGVNGGNATTGTISTSGLYTAPGQPGAHTVTATSVAETSSIAKASVTVVSGLAISPSSSTLETGQTQQFSATVTASSNTAVSWSVDGIAGGNSSVGTITSSGLYTAPSAAGNHTVTASSGAGKSASASASVAVFTFVLSPQDATVAPSTTQQPSTQQFTATIQGISNTAVNWSVDGVAGGNTSTGTISSTGLYTAPAGTGPHTIAASSAADTSATQTAQVTVVNVGQAGVLTYHNDDARDGAYLQEVTLTPQNVNSAQFGKLLSYPVDGQIYAQPLYMPQLSMANGTHDVVFVETQNDSVYAFDADATSSVPPLWKVSLGTPVTKNSEYGVQVVGILSTPVIDATTNTIYLVSENSEKSYTYYLHALDATSGAEKFNGPVPVTGSVAGSGEDSSGGNISLETSCYQRMGLALDPVTNGILIGFGDCPHGWALLYDKTSLAQTAIFNDTPDGSGGGLWSSGGAPAIDDATGDFYLLTGVDAGDDINNGYNDSFLHLSATDLSVLDYFTPDNNLALEQKDADLGAGANILIPGSTSVPNITLGGGKDGNVFVVNRDQMGGFNSGSNNVLQTVQICFDGDNNIFSTPAYWNGSIFYHCNKDVLRAFSWNASTNTLSTKPTSMGTVVYATTHGATPSLSANGSMNGIIWDIDNSAYNGSDPEGSGPAVLHAYDATNVATELYNSGQAGSRDTAGPASKFSVPTVANGRVFVPTSTELDIYGLLPQQQ